MKVWKRWLSSEVERASRLRSEGLRYKQIARLIGRSPRSIESKITGAHIASTRPRYLFSNAIKPHRPAQQLFEDRDARLREIDARDITAALCGDPPPSRSALGRRP